MHNVIQMSINTSGNMCVPVFVHVSMRGAVTIIHMSIHTSVRMSTHMSILVSARLSIRTGLACMAFRIARYPDIRYHDSTYITLEIVLTS